MQDKTRSVESLLASLFSAEIRTITSLALRNANKPNGPSANAAQHLQYRSYDNFAGIVRSIDPISALFPSENKSLLPINTVELSNLYKTFSMSNNPPLRLPDPAYLS